MLLDQIGVTSHIAAGLLFLVLAAFFVRPWRDGLYSPLFILASLTTAIWHFNSTGNELTEPGALEQVLFTTHCALWIGAMLRTLRINLPLGSATQIFWPLAVSLIILSVAGAVITPYLIWYELASNNLPYWNNLLLGLLGLIVAEQLFRNTLARHKQAISFLCAGASFFFLFDLLVFSNALIFSSINASIDNTRAVVNLSAAISLIFATTRSQHSSRAVMRSTPRFYSASLLCSGVFIIAIAASGLYVKRFGGDWASVFLSLAAVLAAVIFAAVLFVPTWRAKTRVLINKYLLIHKYDYRGEWLKLITILSEPPGERDEKDIALEALCSVFHSDGAYLWLKKDGEFQFARSNLSAAEQLPGVTSDSSFIQRLEQDWVYHPSSAAKVDKEINRHLPDWLQYMDSIWIVAPLISQQELIGFIAVSRPDNNSVLSWEDLDVLRNVGRQIASYLALHCAATELAESKQFDAYNKLTAFIMHDLKNLIAQQALVVENAKKHKENPAFVDDAIKTIENSVARMNTLLGKMQQRNKGSQRSLDLGKILLEAVSKCRSKRPAPSLRLEDKSYFVSGDRDHLVMIFSHVIKNAQEATPANGFVDIYIDVHNKMACVTVEDNGQGMNEAFIKERLFKPFDTTKSGQGMGIGVYQTREYIRGLGGELTVVSSEGLGTSFTVALPLHEELAHA